MVSFVLVEVETRPVLMDLIDILTMKALKFTVANDIGRLFAYTYSGSTTLNTSVGLPGPSSDLCNAESSLPSDQKLFNRILKSELIDDEDSIASPSNTVEWINSGVTSIQSPEEQNEDISKEVANTPSGQFVVSVGDELRIGNDQSGFSNLETLAHGLFAERSQSGVIGSSKGLKRSWHYGGTSSFTHTYMKDEDKEDGKKERIREVVCQLCNKKITMRRCNLRHHTAVVHSRFERYVCRCGYSTAHRNTIIRHMVKHTQQEEEKDFEYTDVMTPADHERIERLTEQCFREYHPLPRGVKEDIDVEEN